MLREINPTGKPNLACAVLRLGVFALVGGAIGWGLARAAVDAQQREKAAGWLQLADDFVPAEIEKLKAANQSLALLIQQANGRFGERELARYAPQLLSNLAPNTAFTLAPAGVLTSLYPQDPNTSWRGVNLLEHPRYRHSSSSALSERGTVLQGPAPLLKGGTGMIVRTPVFLGPERQFWGFVNALGPWSTWLNRLESKAQSHDPPMRFGLEIRDSEGSIYLYNHSRSILTKGLPGAPIKVPGGTVTLAAETAAPTASQRILLALAPLTGASIGAALSLLLCQWRRKQQLMQMALKLENAQALERYQAIFQGSLDALLVINRELRFLEANPQVAAMYGAASTEAFLQSTLLDVSPELQPDGRPSAEAVAERINDAFERGSVEFEYLHRRLDSGELWLGQVSLRAIELDGEAVLLTRVRDITETRRYEQRIEELAYRDGLTHLPNRTATQEWLDRQFQQDPARRWLLINLDIDDFRSLNEAFSQQLGDQLIRGLAAALSAALPPGAWLGRLDSDEFLALLPIATPIAADGAEAEAQHWAQALQQRASEAAGEQSGVVPRITLSAGCAITNGATAKDALAAMQQANTALQQAKENGRAAVAVYSSVLSASIQERLALEKDLEQALQPERGGAAFRLVYQPQVNRAGRLLRAEALLRFRRSDGQEVSPDVFIPVAERSGQIHRLGRWVIEHAAAQLALWRDQGLTLVPLSVNISARQLDDLPGAPPLLEQLLECAARHQLVPQDLVLELTETALLKREHQIRGQLRRMVAAGFRLALDDFGTGYSSLAVLRDFPVSQVKIDKGFTRHVGLDPRSCSIVEALVAITRSRRMDLVAEGVETNDQREALIHLGVRLFQGYLFAPPLDAEAFAALLRDPDQVMVA